MTHICPACEEGVLVRVTADQAFAYKGAQLKISGMEFSRCPVCGEEVVLADQEKKNDLKFVDARRKHDGLRTSDQIIAWRKRWNLSQAVAAEIFGGGINAFSRYERGEVVQSQSADLLMQLLDEVEEARLFIERRTGVQFDSYSWSTVPECNVLSTAKILSFGKPKVKVTAAETRFNVQHSESEWQDLPRASHAH